MFILFGFGLCCYDLFASERQFVWNIWRILGVVSLIVGRIIVYMVRRTLIKKAKFSDQFSTMVLKINNNHQLITNGLFKYVRHPLYSGVILMGFGLGLISFSKYGSLCIIIGLIFLIARIQIEENMDITEIIVPPISVI